MSKLQSTVPVLKGHCAWRTAAFAHLQPGCVTTLMEHVQLHGQGILTRRSSYMVNINQVA